MMCSLRLTIVDNNALSQVSALNPMVAAVSLDLTYHSWLTHMIFCSLSQEQHPLVISQTASLTQSALVINYPLASSVI